DRRAIGEWEVAQVELQLTDPQLVVALQLGGREWSILAGADAAAQRHIDRARDRGGAEEHDTDDDEGVRPTDKRRRDERRADQARRDREHHGEVHVERAGGLEQTRDSRADQQRAERERREERAPSLRTPLEPGGATPRASRRWRGPRRGLGPRAR